MKRPDRGDIETQRPARFHSGLWRDAWCTVLLLVVVSSAGAAQESTLPSGTVTDVQVLQEGQPVTDPDILSLIDTAIGKPFSMVEVRESRNHLDGLARFDIEVRSEPTPGGVRVIYALTPLRSIDRVEFGGNLQLSEGTLRQAVRERLGSSMFVSRVPAAVNLLKDRYRDEGYANVSVTYEIVPRPRSERSTLRFTIEAGPRSLVKDVVWQQTDKGALIGLPDVRKGVPYDASGIQRTLDKYVDTMRKNGYYEARAELTPRFDTDGVVVQVDVHRGPHVRVVFTGDPLSRSDQQKLVPVRAEASVAEDLLENSTIAIEQALRERGYRDATAPYSRMESDGELTITFDVHNGPRYVIADMTMPGRQAISRDELLEDVAAKLSSTKERIEALFKEGEPFFEQAALGVADKIKEAYRDRGFSKVTVTPAYNIDVPESPSAPRRVRVVFSINESAKVLLSSLTFSGNASVPTEELLNVFKGAGNEIGMPFSQSNLAAGLAALDAYYHDLGFAMVEHGTPLLGFPGDSADVLVPITENMRVFIDRIIIEGNERTSRSTIERELTLHPGDPLGASKKLESEDRLRGLGFRRVRIDERRHLGDDRVDLLVRVEEGQRTTIEYGPGLEISSRLRPVSDGVAEERIEFVPRGSFQISRTNIFGTNGSASFFSRVSARAKDTVTALGEFDTSYGINEYRVFGTFREPKVLGTPAQALFTAIAERAIRPSYTFVTREGRAEVGGNIDKNYNASVRFSVIKTQLFDVDPNLTDAEKPLIDRLFPQVRLSKFSGNLVRNTRTDLGKPNDLDPSEGTYISIEPEIAARAIGSEVGYVKSLLQVSWYHQLPFTRRTVLALRAVVGAAHGFRRLAPSLDDAGNPVLNADGSPQLRPVQDIPASERFFAGGSTTNRGFSVDQLGQPSLCGDPLKCTFTPGGFPTGGNGEILTNSEVRVSLSKSFAGVAFLDAGNIYKSASDISLGDLRPAVGGGLHYRSPVGLVRVELGINLNRQELTPGHLERGYVLHISLGPAF